ncbi:MAG: hypothetical protein QGG67_05720 [Gammaproteobacteria bacterium]|nr:hypothetical protein [Gammaproteobacteria bacterium]MDP6095473.1 hypothetical protein [Gammaproteobacteria bacterium]HJO12642.1 hypothetical protein [Gammaproteobacteria bacterium]
MTRVQKLIPLILIGMFAPFAANAQSAADIAAAVLPLPEDLRADATVYTYDENTGARIVLKQGSNFFECQPLNEESGFTRCQGTAGSGRRDLSAKLSAQGLSGEELQAALTAAENRGEIAPRLFGSVAYRTYNQPDRIQLLMVVSLPGATAESLGMPTGRQRDNALAGKGRPWMMRPGTPGAHLMIPINGTDLSNQP